MHLLMEVVQFHLVYSDVLAARLQRSDEGGWDGFVK